MTIRMEHTHEQNRISSLNPRAGRRSQDSLIFIPVENPMYKNQNPSSRFAIRSHVAKQTRLTQCRQQAERQQNYRNTTSVNFRQTETPRVGRSSRSLCEHDEAEATTIPPPVGLFEPFGCFPVSVSYLATLLYDKPARGIGEPIFSINSKDPLHSISTVFQGTCLSDDTICNGVALCIEFATNNWILDVKSLHRISKLINLINERLAHQQSAVANTTIAGILCLVTVEHRLGNRLTVEKHMSGINQILEIRKSTSIPLPSGLKRALFWQDLFATMFMGTTRLFQYDTFFEMQGMKDQLSITFSKLPSGFENNRDMLTPELISVVEDLGAFTLYVDEGDENGNRSDLMFRTQVGCQQAGIESRLVNIQSERHGLDLITSSLCSALLICTYFLDTETWKSNFVSSHLSGRLINNLEQLLCCDRKIRFELFFWIIQVGYLGANEPVLKKRYQELYSVASFEHIFSSDVTGYECLALLKTFVWSTVRFGVPKEELRALGSLSVIK